jgi:HTH-type transcriptional regulator/antitoxin HigA
MITAVHRRAAGDRYLELVREFPLRPIRSKTDYRRATNMMDRLATHDEGSLPRDQQDYLDTLCLLIEQYDRTHRPLTPRSDPLARLKHLMQESGMTVSALGELLGSKSVASEILHGKRSLSKAHIVRLARYFKLDASTFLPSE